VVVSALWWTALAPVLAKLALVAIPVAIGAADGLFVYHYAGDKSCPHPNAHEANLKLLAAYTVIPLLLIIALHALGAELTQVAGGLIAHSCLILISQVVRWIRDSKNP
jgi:hypothetical protein